MRTGLLSIDLSKAFDVIERDKLLAKVDTTNLRPNLKRWLCAYLRDRKTRVRYQGVLSKWMKSKMGVPQGSVISPHCSISLSLILRPTRWMSASPTQMTSMQPPVPQNWMKSQELLTKLRG